MGIALTTASGLVGAEELFVRPASAAVRPAPWQLPAVQYDFGNYIAPAEQINGTMFRFGPLYTAFVPAVLRRNPTREDRLLLAAMLDEVELRYPYSPAGAMMVVSYGLPYFERFPQSLFRKLVPTSNDGSGDSAFLEAVPSPTDVTSGGSVTKATFNVPVQIEANEVLFSIRSDSLKIVNDIIGFLQGSGRLAGQSSPLRSTLLNFQETRLMFVQPGLPRQIANGAGLSYASEINPQSPMWMGFSSQQVNGGGPVAITTMAGNSSAKLTNAKPGDYFALAAIQHFSHNILDLAAFYSKPHENYAERVGYMFRSNPLPTPQTGDGFTNGGGTAWVPNQFNGTGDAAANAAGTGTVDGVGRFGHLNALQRSSRAADGTPIHNRMDGTGFDSMDVPGGSQQPKLQFSIFVPSSQFFATMRTSQASTDLATQNNVTPLEQGIERFMTATRRQNFLVPPRSLRALPFVELVG
jgi:hypothetical protein